MAREKKILSLMMLLVVDASYTTQSILRAFRACSKLPKFKAFKDALNRENKVEVTETGVEGIKEKCDAVISKIHGGNTFFGLFCGTIGVVAFLICIYVLFKNYYAKDTDRGSITKKNLSFLYKVSIAMAIKNTFGMFYYFANPSSLQYNTFDFLPIDILSFILLDLMIMAFVLMLSINGKFNNKNGKTGNPPPIAIISTIIISFMIILLMRNYLEPLYCFIIVIFIGLGLHSIGNSILVP